MHKCLVGNWILQWMEWIWAMTGKYTLKMSAKNSKVNADRAWKGPWWPWKVANHWQTWLIYIGVSTYGSKMMMCTLQLQNAKLLWNLWNYHFIIFKSIPGPRNLDQKTWKMVGFLQGCASNKDGNVDGFGLIQQSKFSMWPDTAINYWWCSIDAFGLCELLVPVESTFIHQCEPLTLLYHPYSKNFLTRLSWMASPKAKTNATIDCTHVFWQPKCIQTKLYNL